MHLTHYTQWDEDICLLIEGVRLMECPSFGSFWFLNTNIYQLAYFKTVFTSSSDILSSS